jgi:hypothetical protein
MRLPLGLTASPVEMLAHLLDMETQHLRMAILLLDIQIHLAAANQHQLDIQIFLAGLHLFLLVIKTNQAH